MDEFQVPQGYRATKRRHNKLDDLDIDKLKTVPVDLKKLSNVVSKDK